MHSRTTRCQIFAALLLATLSVAASAHATTLARMTLPQLARAAGAVVRARCASTSTRWENGAIWTFSDFDVVERFKGGPPSRVRVRTPGGRVGHIATRVEDAPTFRAGDEAVLFLEAAPDGTYGVTAWTEGTFRIRKDSATSLERVSEDSSGVPSFDPVTRQFRTEGTRNLPWSEFRQRLTTALSQPNAGGRQ
jgi:hypothetical protein